MTNADEIARLRAENEQLRAELRQAGREDPLRGLFEAVFRSAADAMVLADDSGRYTDANQAACELFGLPHHELVGRRVNEFAGPAYDVGSEWNTFRRASGLSGTFPLKRADGKLRILDYAAVTNVVPGQHLSVLRDVTERHSTARKTEALLAWLVASSSDAIISKDLDGRITSWNKAAEELFGYTAEEALGQNIRMLIPGEREREEGVLSQRVETGSPVRSLETVRLGKDGRRIEVEISLSPITDHEGRVVGASKIARDLTARRRAEAALRQMEEQLSHAQKMEAVGQLAGGVAHDFNNLLMVILSYTELLTSALSDLDPRRMDVEEIAHAAHKATDLTRQLLAFGRRQVLRPRALDLNVVLSRMERMLRRLIGERIELVIVVDRDISLIEVDEGQLEQVIVNLVVNARDAMPDGGTITLETREVVLDREYAAAHLGVVPGIHVELAVSDTGVGMSRQTRDRIFEPFFTTKGRERGSGLGLSSVFGIIKQSGGHISVDSEPGQGTTFEVVLPRAGRGVTTAAEPRTEALPSPRGSERILLVEDDPQVRKVTSMVLRHAGYVVLEAASGPAALTAAELSEERIDLLLTDVVMPGMTGRQVADALLARMPHLRVLYVSGYTEDAIVHHGVLDDGIAFLPKPASPRVLLEKVRGVLDASIDRALEATRVPSGPR